APPPPRAGAGWAAAPQRPRRPSGIAFKLLSDRRHQRAAARDMAAAALLAAQRGQAIALERLAQPPQALAAHAKRPCDLAGRPALAQQRRQHAVAPQRGLVSAEAADQLGAAEAWEITVRWHEVSMKG